MKRDTYLILAWIGILGTNLGDGAFSVLCFVMAVVYLFAYFNRLRKS